MSESIHPSKAATTTGATRSSREPVIRCKVMCPRIGVMADGRIPFRERAVVGWPAVGGGSVPGLDIGVQQNQVMMRVEYRDVPSKGLVTTEVHSGDFEAGERGVQAGSLMIPWQRVHEY